MDTSKVKMLLFEAMQNPTKKRMALLAEHVIQVCDECDSQESLTGIIRAGNESLEHSFSMLQSLMNSQRER